MKRMALLLLHVAIWFYNSRTDLIRLRMNRVFLLLFMMSHYIGLAQVSQPPFSDGLQITLTKNNHKQVKQQIKTIDNDSLLKIKWLVITGDFKSVPAFVFEFENTIDLEICSSQKIKLTHKLNNLSHLKQIRITGEVTSISKDIKLPEIEKLYISNYTGKEFPVAICQWPTLKELDLQGGSFGAVPNEIANFVNMENLNLSNNKIRSLPDEIGLLQNLKSLGLSKNPLSSFPYSVCGLHKLKTLYITHTPLLTITGKQFECLQALPDFEEICRF